MANEPNRREIIASSGALAVAVVASASSAAAAAQASPSPIEAAYHEYARLAVLHDNAFEARREIRSGFQEPERPRFHHFRSSGAYDIEYVDAERTRGRSFIRMDDENVAELEARIAQPFDPSNSDPLGVEWDRKSHAEHVEQARVTLETIKAWRAEYERRAEASGLIAAEAAYTKSRAAAQAQLDALLAMEPTTFRDVALQALVSHEKDGPGFGPVYRTLDRLTELAGVKHYYDDQEEDAA